MNIFKIKNLSLYGSVLSCFILFAGISLKGQIHFERVSPPLPAPQNFVDFLPVIDGHNSAGDIDNDGDLDVVITGSYDSRGIAKLYLNDGLGNYSETDSDLEGVLLSYSRFGDIDNDGDLDLIISGEDSTYTPTTKLYLNNGSGEFSLDTVSVFHGLVDGLLTLGDVDNDGDLDLMTYGYELNFIRRTRLYLNDGTGIFSLVVNTSFEGLIQGTLDLADLDNDGDLDVFITGMNSDYDERANLYLNDGNGSFSLALGSAFIPVRKSAVAINDVNGDTYLDVIVTGQRSGAQQHTTTLYLNNGNGDFYISSSSTITGVQSGSVALEDLDGDLDLDLIISGGISSGAVLQVYLNDGLGAFSIKPNPNFYGVSESSISMMDVENDGDLDILISGTTQNIWLYINDGSANFNRVSQTPFPELTLGDNAFADIDGDGDMDAILQGYSYFNQNTSILYTNDGAGQFSVVSGTPFPRLTSSCVAFCDIDGDGDEDLAMSGIILSGYDAGDRTFRMYLNDGSGNFSYHNTTITPVNNGTMKFADIDLDGDSDLLVIGSIVPANTAITKLYLNDGNGVFSEVQNTPFENVASGDIAFGDVDNDSDLDIIITGGNFQTNQKSSKLYFNDGNGVFTEDVNAGLAAVWFSAIELADIDGDEDLDLLLTGLDNSSQPTSLLYSNDGQGHFSLMNGSSLLPANSGDVAFADFDNDGDQDLFITGSAGYTYNANLASLYENDGFGNFEIVSQEILEGVVSASAAVADIENDGYLDLLVSGQNRANERSTWLYKNITYEYLNPGYDVIVEFDWWVDTYPQVDVNIQIQNTATDMIELNETFPMESNGTITIPNILPGTYNILVQVSGSLAEIVYDVVVVNSSTTITIDDVITGDINEDNIINAYDVSSLNFNWNSSVEDPFLIKIPI